MPPFQVKREPLLEVLVISAVENTRSPRDVVGQRRPSVNVACKISGNSSADFKQKSDNFSVRRLFSRPVLEHSFLIDTGLYIKRPGPEVSPKKNMYNHCSF